MFIGDKGYCVDSTIKGHLKYEDQWKSRKNSLYTSVCITNEHNTSQTCLFCFKKLQHPLRVTGNVKLKIVSGTFQCINLECTSVLADMATHARDSLSAMAIDLSGLATLLFGATFLQFDPKLQNLNIPPLLSEKET
ncbi:hypothetical protein BCV72DRAFT_324767 [Rhizopus microsporus var. microsporus]|uniref:Uncharacterized protein n=2 Tax=Rhizopus microsporus TaxID=58291 RepID=A0A1X0QM60_RHIZD|nr:hypothetical protein BCV72DRAFT_324767 [Rhizopus microsporus var. microsporus]